ncbi:MAG: VWA domain-containing protein [Haloarculaceae archaeon]
MLDHTPGVRGRGQSGIIGFTIITALVIVVAMFVVFAGGDVLDALQQERADSEATFVMEDVESQLTTITSSDRSTTGHFSMGGIDRLNPRIVRRGYLNVTVNENGTCGTQIPLSSIRYENGENETVAYQAGGVWVANRNGSAMQTAPDVQFRNGSLDVTVVNITGEVTRDRNAAVYNATSSTRESARRSQQVIAGSCVRPDNVTLRVKSDFYEAWAGYLRGELNASAPGTTVESFASNETVVAYLDQNRLPRRVDDTRNHVINMSRSPMASYMDAVSIKNNTLRVGKSVSNEYTVYVEPLSKGRIDIGEIRDVNATNVTGPPIDVVFVLDQSGSMAWHIERYNGTTPVRIEAAREAIKNSTVALNESVDRVGLVGYSTSDNRPYWAPDNDAWIWRTPSPNGRILVPPIDAFNNTVDSAGTHGGTAGSAGLHKANAVLTLKSNQTRKRLVVFLSDGVFNEQEMGYPDTERNARRAALQRAGYSASQGLVVHTVGFGKSAANFNETVLEVMANKTGGDYKHASNASELEEFFTNTIENASKVEAFARWPTTISLSTGGGGVYAPQIPGDTDGIANVTRNGRRFLNINDPTAPAQFTFAFALSDNESIAFNASLYSCEKWRGTEFSVSKSGKSYQEVRCTQMTTRNETIGPENVTVYTDGENATDLLGTSGNRTEWQNDTVDAIDNRPDVSRNASNFLEMKSNQALVVLDYPDAVNTTNRLAVLYQIGRAESEASPEDVINIRVRNVRVEP